jgi:uncharacterized membrane protein YgcG
MAMLAIAACLTSPAASIAGKGAATSYEKDVEALPGDASPKEACAVLIKHNKVKPAQEVQCRRLVADGFEAAKTVSDDGDLTIHAATACVAQVLAQKKSPGVTKQCTKHVVENEEARRDREDDDDGGGLFGAAAGFVGGVVDDVSGAVGGAIEGTILDSFNAIIDFLFGGLQAMITVALIKWIITIPNLSGGHVGDLESRIALGAGALLAATMTVSVVRFWASGLTGSGAWAGAEGIARTAVAACLIGLWPRIFDLAVKVSNALQSGILNEGAEHQLKSLFQNIGKVGFFTAGTVPVFLSIVTAIVGMLMLLALVAMKIIITSLTIVLFCAMPLALVLWPVPELSGAAKFCLRSLGVVLAIPVVWCVLFGAFAAIGADTFTFHNTGKDQGIFGTTLNVAIVKPLVSISLLYLALVMPRRLLQMAPFMGGGGGGIVRTVATGAALRAGFSYAPQGASAATAGWKGNPSERLQVHGSPFEKRAMEAGRGLRGIVNPKGAANANPAASKSSGAQGGATARAKGAQQGQALPTRDKNGDLQPPGPWTTQQRIPHKENVEAGEREMHFNQESGQRGAVEQAKRAYEALDGMDDQRFYDSGVLAGRYWNNDQATKALADWSQNPAVPPEARDAFWTLGGTPPAERRLASERYANSRIIGGDSSEIGDVSSGSTSSGSGSSSSRSASDRASSAPAPPSSASERGRPSPPSSSPSPSRPSARPPQGGGSS